MVNVMVISYILHLDTDTNIRNSTRFYPFLGDSYASFSVLSAKIWIKSPVFQSVSKRDSTIVQSQTCKQLRTKGLATMAQIRNHYHSKKGSETNVQAKLYATASSYIFLLMSDHFQKMSEQVLSCTDMSEHFLVFISCSVLRSNFPRNQLLPQDCFFLELTVFLVNPYYYILLMYVTWVII